MSPLGYWYDSLNLPARVRESVILPYWRRTRRLLRAAPERKHSLRSRGRWTGRSSGEAHECGLTSLPPKVEALHNRIKKSEVLPQDDKDALLQFSDELGAHNYSTGRRVKLLQHCTMMAGDSEKYSPDQLPEPDLVDMIGDTETEKKKAKRYVSWINGNYDSEESKRITESHSGCSGAHYSRGS